MKMVIVEDEAIAARRLAQLISEIFPESEVLAELNSVGKGMKWFAENPMPDLIFLDIQLNDGYGFDLLDAFPQHAPVIFTTAYNEYAIRGFRYNGLDYLLKPIDKKDLSRALEKYTRVRVSSSPTPLQLEQFKKLLRKEYKHRFMVKIGNQYRAFAVEDIAYFKSHSGGIHLHTHQGKAYPIDYSLDQLEEILDPIRFFRINRKYTVSVESVNEIHTYFNSRLQLNLKPKESDQVIVARERAGRFKEWLDL